MLRTLRIAISAAALGVLAQPAAAIDFNFFQGGFAEDAFVSGTFSAEDSDLNGQVSSFDGEVSALSFSFSGNSLNPAFTADLDDLIGLVFDLNGSNVLGDGTDGVLEGIAVEGPDGLQYIAGPGPFNICDGESLCGIIGVGVFIGQPGAGGPQLLSLTADDTSTEVVTVNEVGSVPLPAPILMLGAAAVGLGLMARRRRA